VKLKASAENPQHLEQEKSEREIQLIGRVSKRDFVENFQALCNSYPDMKAACEHNVNKSSVFE